jgi:hypothetical protein
MMGRPAERVRVCLITEADARLVDHPLLLVDDVDWLRADEFQQLHRRGGLEAELAERLPCEPAVTAQELHAVKLGLVERALADDFADDDRRRAAFRCGDLARYDPEAALAAAEQIVAALREDDDHDGIAAAFAYLLDEQRGRPSCEALIERWRSQGGLRADVLDRLTRR